MRILDFLLYLAAVVCFGLAAFGGTLGRVSLVALGLAFAFTPLLLAAFLALH